MAKIKLYFDKEIGELTIAIIEPAQKVKKGDELFSTNMVQDMLSGNFKFGFSGSPTPPDDYTTQLKVKVARQE